MGEGLLALIAVSSDDTIEKIKWFANKLVNLRIFPDEQDKINKSVADIGGSLMLISNFTVYGDTNKGFRPNFSNAAPPQEAEKIFRQTRRLFQKELQYSNLRRRIRCYDGHFLNKCRAGYRNRREVALFILSIERKTYKQKGVFFQMNFTCQVEFIFFYELNKSFIHNRKSAWILHYKKSIIYFINKDKR
jgi:D-tyrosyl-tRNA(Tyr) deacylase